MINKPLLAAGDAVTKEYAAGTELLPGILVQRNGENALIKAGKGCQEAMLVDYSSVNGMDDNTVYCTGDQVPVLIPNRGAEIIVFTSEGIDRGDFLAIADGGLVCAADLGAGEAVVGVALTSASTDEKILMEVL